MIKEIFICMYIETNTKREISDTKWVFKIGISVSNDDMKCLAKFIMMFHKTKLYRL